MIATDTIENAEPLKSKAKRWKKHRSHNSRGSSSCVYFLGMIGAAVFYISASTTFWGGMLGFLKALVWPAFLVFEAFSFLAAGV
jgi:hypothetical protein